MDATTDTTDQMADGTTAPTDAGPEHGSEVEVRREVRLTTALAAGSLLVALAWLVRAAGWGGAGSWLTGLALLGLAAAYARAVHDARTPLLVADEQGLRLRLGRDWTGLPWDAVEEVEHLPRRGRLRDGRLVVFPLDPDAVLDGLPTRARWHARLAERLHGAPFAVPLGLATTVRGGADPTEALAALADGRCEIVEIVDATSADDLVTLDPSRSEPPVGTTDRLLWEESTDEVPVVPEADLDPDATAAMGAVGRVLPEDTVDFSPVLDVRLVGPAPAEDTGVWRASTELIHDLSEVPVVDPTIGPRLAAARERLGLRIEQLAERTRIRPHVIEAMEIDDFVPCGGDFYARGHLRTLARVLGLDAAPLLATYDERYADAPIDPRRVFEADLNAARGSLSGSLTRTGPNWSVLVAAVMALVLCWSVARLIMDRPVDTPATPSLANGSGGISPASADLAPPVPVIVTAAGGGARVIVRDGGGAVVFKGELAFGESRSMQASPPVRVQSTDGSLEVRIDGDDRGALGKTGEPAENRFVVR
ncbi:RodZ family helix-turn-helix domain-containing protein [Nocardioides sp. SYSU D00038]|uniref:helix-turn-helix domain-containing protein n=1 Tax=Nocardioides sp. SYSU D00038 TaxID=2812554 RepID=UPI001966E212|nr:helix-turn-helix domain-containing protein [Nocardioides sp. SYSU D00038]